MDADMRVEEASTYVDELADALREVLSSHYCGQITCSRALSTLNGYEQAAGAPRFTPAHAGRLVADPDAAPGALGEIGGIQQADGSWRCKCGMKLGSAYTLYMHRKFDHKT
jgi:hypothetical protein